MEPTSQAADIPPNWRSLHELDREHGWGKGQAFRAFKAIVHTLHEGTDYRVFAIESHPGLLARWRASGRLHAGSVRLIVLSPAVAAKLAA